MNSRLIKKFAQDIVPGDVLVSPRVGDDMILVIGRMQNTTTFTNLLRTQTTYFKYLAMVSFSLQEIELISAKEYDVISN